MHIRDNIFAQSNFVEFNIANEGMFARWIAIGENEKGE